MPFLLYLIVPPILVTNKQQKNTSQLIWHIGDFCAPNTAFFFLPHITVLISVRAAPEHSITQIVLKLTMLVLYVLTARPYTAVYLCTSDTCNIQEKLLCLLAGKR